MMKNSNRGFTLIEIMVVSVIASMMGILVLTIFVQSRKTQPKISANLQMQSAILTGMNKFVRSIREGIHFVSPRLDEDSPVIIFIDNENNFRSIFAIEDVEYSNHYKKRMYKLVQYISETKPLNLLNPIHNSKNLKEICRNVVDLSFRLSCSDSVTANIRFGNKDQDYEIVSEANLMNSGE